MHDLDQWYLLLFDRDVKVGSKVLGKKHNDIWYRGTVVDMTESQDVANVSISHPEFVFIIKKFGLHHVHM